MIEHSPSTDPATGSRLDELERRLRDVERALEGGVPDPGHARADVDSGTGTVHYGGEVHLHGDIDWQISYDAGAALDLDDDPRTAVLSALGHPVRVRIVRSLLRGPRGTAELGEAAELASTGQLYHHLRALTHCGLVEQDGRGSYRIAPRTVVPALVLLTAAADIAGQLGTR